MFRVNGASEEDLGATLRKAREQVALTQVELARHLGVSSRSVQGWEAGTSYPQPKQRRRIAAFLAEAGEVAA